MECILYLQTLYLKGVCISGPKPSYLESYSNSLVYQVMFLLQTFKFEIPPDWIALFEIVWLMMVK
jgi:hypothetical protein